MIREIGVALVTHDCKPRASGDDPPMPHIDRLGIA